MALPPGHGKREVAAYAGLPRVPTTTVPALEDAKRHPTGRLLFVLLFAGLCLAPVTSQAPDAKEVFLVAASYDDVCKASMITAQDMQLTITSSDKDVGIITAEDAAKKKRDSGLTVPVTVTIAETEKEPDQTEVDVTASMAATFRTPSEAKASSRRC